MQWARWGGGVGAMLAVAVIAATAVVAAQGDALLVTGNNVNVRAGPSTDAGILARVGIDEPATELRRLGAWVEVALPGQDVLGWIHGSLLAAAPPTADAVPEPVREPAPEPAPLAVAAVDPAPMSPPDPAAASRSAPAAVPGPIAGPAERPAAVVAAAPATDAVPDAEVDPNTPLGQFRSEVEHFNDRAVAAAGVDLFTGVKPLGEGGVQVVTTDAWAIMSVPGQQSYLNALFGRWQAATGGGDDLRLQIIDANGSLMMERSGP